MTKYKDMLNGKLVNAAALKIKPDKAGRSSAGDCGRASERFLKSAANLPGNGFLGWQIETGRDNTVMTAAFTGTGVRTMASDYDWIFQKCAEAGSRPAEMLNDLYADGRRVYVLVSGSSRLVSDIKKKAELEDVFVDLDDFDEDDGDYCSGSYFMEMFDILQQEGAVIRMTADKVPADGNGCGRLFISLPQNMNLSLRTAISLAFPDMYVKELPEDGPEDAAAGCISEGFFLDSFARFLTVLRNRAVIPLTPERLTKIPIDDMEFSVRTYNCLKRAGIHTAGQLQELNEEDLREIRNLGEKSILEIQEKLEELEVQVTDAGEGQKALSCGAEAEKESADTGPENAPRSAFDRLNDLVGLENVKEQVRKIAAFARMKKAMRQDGKNGISLALNMEFTGNPGTAKTTVARILAEIFYETGLLADRTVVEAGRADLVARYVGQTAEKVKDVFRKAKGRLLFIDEAYSLSENWKGSYGDEAINTIVQEMENRRDDTVVIFAGYPEEMEEFFSRNPGLRSRVPFSIRFSDYSPEELLQIAVLEAERRGFTLSPQAEGKVLDICKSVSGNSAAGNGRFCRNLVESAVLNYAFRIYGAENPDSRTPQEHILSENDFSLAEGFPEEKKTRPIGFRAN